MNPWLFFATCRVWLNNIVHAALGTRVRQVFTLLAAVLIVFIWVNIGADEEALDISEAELDQAINLSHYFEKQNRKLKQDIETELRLRRVAQQTITALSENIRQQDETILNLQQQLAFYRQLLVERDRPADEIVIRSFEIIPDFREYSYQLLAVLVRGGAGSEPFRGRLDLALSLRNTNGEEFEHRPVFEIGALDTEFRYYHEIEAVFAIPPDTEILNGQLALFSEDGELMSSSILVDQTL